MGRDPSSITPDEFELFVKRRLAQVGRGLKDFVVLGKRVLQGLDGEYEIDASATFEAMGAHIRVIVECKRHKNSIKRELVQVLHDKVRSLGAHKGMMFSTSEYQSGAVEFATAHGLALFWVQTGSTVAIAKNEDAPTPVGKPEFVAWRVLPSAESGTQLSLLDPVNEHVLEDFF
jgi:restriction system protein